MIIHSIMAFHLWSSMNHGHLYTMIEWFSTSRTHESWMESHGLANLGSFEKLLLWCRLGNNETNTFRQIKLHLYFFTFQVIFSYFEQKQVTVHLIDCSVR